MKILLFFGLACIGISLCCTLWACKGQQHGLNGQTFVSNGRPALAVTPADTLRLWGDGWCDAAPATRTSEQGSAKLWYALYSTDGQAPQPGRLLVLLAEGQGKWAWPFEPGSPRELLRKEQRTEGNTTTYRETLLVSAEQDVWADAWEQRWQNGTLARRFRVFFMNRQVKLVVEYREPVDKKRPLPVAMDMPLLAAFEARAEQSFSLLLQDAGVNIPEVSRRPETAPKELSRRQLAVWLGEMYQRGDIN